MEPWERSLGHWKPAMPWERSLGDWRHATGGDGRTWTLLPLHPPPSYTFSTFVTASHHDVFLYHRPKVTESTNCRSNCDQGKFFLFISQLMQVFHYSNGRLVQLHWILASNNDDTEYCAALKMTEISMPIKTKDLFSCKLQ